MASLSLPTLLHLAFFILLSPCSVAARNHVRVSTVGTKASELQTYVVHVQPPTSTVFGTSTDRETWYKSFLPETPARIVHMYTNVASGFAARLTELELEDMKKKPGFLHAYPDRLYSLQTTHTPEFLGLQLNSGIWNDANYGKGVIVGMLDTGIFPDHPSFSGDGMPPPPAKWKGRCDFNASLCNNKLIGARTFISGAMAMKGRGVAVTPPVDDVGHGTHTASTAAGARVAGANVLGNANGTASGMAPLAHLAMYKVCTEDGCAESDILAGMDAAVADGVDVLSLSLGGNSVPFYNDSIAIGGFGAIKNGIFVSCAAGNSGPNASSLSNEAPWLLTVAASTMDRNIRVTVKLGNGLEFNGESVYQPQMYTPTFYPLVYAGAGPKPDAIFCGNGSLDGLDVKGKMVLCQRGGGIARIDKGVTVESAGGVGFILANGPLDGYSTITDPHVLPASHVGYSDGVKIKSYISTSSNPTASFIFKGTILGISPAPAITSFSSRGPSLASPGILKPDITGPGVSVLAAWPSNVGPPTVNSTGPTFNIISGTSMSTPHLSGIAALLKAAHPDWSPAAIKSAIMTTADILDRSGDPIVNEQHLPANLFAVGAGHVNPVKANDPGLVYDLSADDYISYLCGLGYTSSQVTAIVRQSVNCLVIKNITEAELNYPSISVSLGPATTSITVERTVKNVGEAMSVYSADIDTPYGVAVSVSPMKLQFSEVNQEMKFYVTFSASSSRGAARFSPGYLNWASEKRMVRSPISVTFGN
uniref:Subtilisin-like protease SBT1.5 n=1 Tax=Elaeis guineensis var. tenera TaxID=51953 RepID=A0A6I9R6Y2_ELAGV|nr:subtilisin-like protease SBT1.5 [Elaeis guineensis]